MRLSVAFWSCSRRCLRLRIAMSASSTTARKRMGGPMNGGNSEALDSAAKNRGGVVDMPRGLYRIDDHLVIPPGVCLSGEWQAPTMPTPKAEP